jgi:hypothetical protein
MPQEQLIMAHIELPVRIIDNMVEPLQEYLHISFTKCEVLPERTDCNLQTALSDKIYEYLHEQDQFQESSPIEQLHEESEEMVQNISEPDSVDTEEQQQEEEYIDNTSQYITLEELSNKKKAIHHKHSTFKKRPKKMHNLTCKLRFIS